MNQSDLTVGNISDHIRRITIPASIGMLFNTLYNVVDTIYAGRLGTPALAGMSLSFPVFYLMLAVAMGIGNGSTALMSNALGEKDRDKFHDYCYNALVMGSALAILLTLFSRFISKGLMEVMGAEGLALTNGMSYLTMIFHGTIFFVLNMILNSILTSQGDTRPYRNALVLGFFLNLILDPLFIYGWFGLPKMGTAGVALATVIVQVISVIYLAFKVMQSQIFDYNVFRQMKVTLACWYQLAKQSIPASMNMMTIALGVFVINYFVIKYSGDATIAAYGVGVRIEQLALLPALGLNTAALTISGQNYGGKQYDRIVETYKKTLMYGTMIMVAGMIIIYTFASFLVSLFNSDPEVIREGVRYLRIEFICFNTYVMMGLSISVLQGLKRPGIALYVGLYRQILMPVIIFYLLGTTLGLGIFGVWYGVVIINWSATVFTVLYTVRKLREVKVEMAVQ